MSLANFFGKNALAAHQILGGMTPETFAGLLGARVVEIVFDTAAVASAEGRTTLELATNLAARLYPRVRIRGLGGGAEVDVLAREMRGLATAINPEIELLSPDGTGGIAVVVGSTQHPSVGDTQVFYAGSRGWCACFSPAAPVGSGATQNPMGAAAAACFALANVFRAVFSPYLERAEPDNTFALSLLDYLPRDLDTGADHAGPALPEEGIDLGETMLAGVGAIGSAAVWALARVPELRGKLHLIDPQTVALSNLQRYVLALQEHAAIALAKVDVAAAALSAGADSRRGSALNVVPHRATWAGFLDARGDWTIGRVLTAFDTVEDRIAAQAALPRRLLNAWTQLGNLGVSRHLSFGKTPCVACLHRPRAGGKSEAELIGDAMGLPGTPEIVRELLHSGAPIGEEFIRGVATRREIEDPDGLEVLLRFAPASLRSFYSDAFCGGVILRLGGRTEGAAARAEAPMAFQSALAGVMLAAELVIDVVGHRDPSRTVPSRVVIDLLRPLAPYLHEPATRRTDGLCLCNDFDYLAAYAAKYTTGP